MGKARDKARDYDADACRRGYARQVLYTLAGVAVAATLALLFVGALIGAGVPPSLSGPLGMIVGFVLGSIATSIGLALAEAGARRTPRAEDPLADQRRLEERLDRAEAAFLAGLHSREEAR